MKLNLLTMFLVGSLGIVGALEASMTDVSMSGALLGGANAIRGTGSEDSMDQFDYALNLDVGFVLNDELFGGAQLQTGPGNGSLGFSGPEAVLTDVFLQYSPSGRDYEVLMGSFDTPFGQYTSYLTNNASSVDTAFVVNPLLYQAFAGAVGTLNGVGVMGQSQMDEMSLSVAVTNGTNEDSNNADGRFGSTVRLVRSFGGNLSVGGSMIRSNDSGTTGSFDSDFSGWMIDGIYSLTDRLSIATYYSALEYDDSDDSTEDGVTSMMAEGQYVLNDYIVSLRVDAWTPEDDDYSSTFNSRLPNPGFLATGDRYDVSVVRYQAGITYPINEYTQLKGEAFLSEYDAIDRTIKGIFVYSVVVF